MERMLSFAMLKPLGTEEPLRSEILNRLETISYIQVCKRITMTDKLAQDLYWTSGHTSQGVELPHFQAIVTYLSGRTVEPMILSSKTETDDFVSQIDHIIGDWKPEETKEGQIRHILIEREIPYIFSVDTPEGSNNYVYDNLIHSSDSLRSAMREMHIFFTERDVLRILNRI